VLAAADGVADAAAQVDIEQAAVGTGTAKPQAATVAEVVQRLGFAQPTDQRTG